MNTDTLLEKFLHYFSLESEVDDFDKIHESMTRDITFKGTNLWILMFAIVVASVGLNMNSTAVIIGAMLISPLMGPINGLGYSIATYDLQLFQKAMKNFSFAVAAGLIASTTYFALSPISTAHSELLARTSPTIYDVIIALFGGMAGMVAISSRQKGNVIPGVAIATALMPPLCTAGYGIATFQMSFFLGAIYLFTINTVFIAVAALIVSRILKFPLRMVVEEVRKKRINRWISFIITLIFIPSIFFGYRLVQQERFQENAKQYVNNVRTYSGNLLLSHSIDPRTKTITLVYGGSTLTESQKSEIRSKAAGFYLPEKSVVFGEGLAIQTQEDKSEGLERITNELIRLNHQLLEKDQIIDSLKDIIRNNSSGE